ncbi:MAG: O-antigen ligase family protein [Clostridiales bacterium]|nr:O-antigen ligase family protein [Clostridiales bacterium]
MDLMLSQYTFFLPIAIMGILLSFHNNKSPRYHLNNYNLSILFMLTSIILSTVFARDVTYSLRWIFVTFQFVILYYFYKTVIINEIRLTKLYFTVIVSSLIPILFGLKDFLKFDGRIYSLLNNPNEVAAFMGFSIFLILPLIFLTQNKIYRSGSLLYLFICIIVLMGTQSRGGQFAMAVSLLTYFLIRGKNFKQKIMITFLFILISGIAILTIAKPFLLRFTQLNNLGYSEFDRIGMWIAAIKLFKQSPLIGIGINNYYKYYIYEHPFFFQLHLQQLPVAHNLFLNTLAEQGIIGLSALVIILSRLFKNINYYVKSLSPKVKEIGFAFMGFFVFFITHNLLDTVWTSYAHEVSTMTLMIFILFVNISKKYIRS